MLSSATTRLWKSFRRSRTQFRDRPETVRLHPGTGVHLHPGILFGIIPEHRSESSRNRVHLAPETPARLNANYAPFDWARLRTSRRLIACWITSQASSSRGPSAKRGGEAPEFVNIGGVGGAFLVNGCQHAEGDGQCSRSFVRYVWAAESYKIDVWSRPFAAWNPQKPLLVKAIRLLKAPDGGICRGTGASGCCC